MLSKDTYAYVMNRISNASNAELLVIRDQLDELLGHPISVDKELRRDTKKLIDKINDEFESRYDLYLLEKRRINKTEKKPASAAVVPIHRRRSDV